MSHYDAKSAYNNELGRALADKFDADIARMLIKAGKINNSTAASSAGLRPFDDDVYTSPRTLSSDSGVSLGARVFKLIKDGLVEWKNKKVLGSPVVVLDAEHYYALLDNPAQVSMTWVNDPYRQSGQVPMVLGCPVYTSPNLPKENDNNNPSVDVKYQADFTGTIGAMFTKDAIGVLKMLDLQVRVDYVPARLADLMVAKMLVGLGILNHACSIAFVSNELADIIDFDTFTISGDSTKEFGASGFETILLKATFDKAVVVTGNPYIRINNDDGANVICSFARRSNDNKTVEFEYTLVDASRNAAAGKLDIPEGAKIVLNGGSIQGESGETVSLELPALDLSAYSIAFSA